MLTFSIIRTLSAGSKLFNAIKAVMIISHLNLKYKSFPCQYAYCIVRAIYLVAFSSLEVPFAGEKGSYRNCMEYT